MIFPFTSTLPLIEALEPVRKIVPEPPFEFPAYTFPLITLLFDNDIVPVLYMLPSTDKFPVDKNCVFAPTEPSLIVVAEESSTLSANKTKSLIFSF